MVGVVVGVFVGVRNWFLSGLMRLKSGVFYGCGVDCYFGFKCVLICFVLF